MGEALAERIDRSVNTELTDEEIFQQVVAGQVDDFAILVRCYQNRLFGYCYRFAASREDAEDLTQEIFLKTYRGRESFQANRSFRTWLFAIAHHTIANYLRDRKATLSLEDEEIVVVDQEPSALDALWQLDVRGKVRQAVASLPGRYREVIDLYYQQQFSYQEIAEALDIPVNTVKTRLHRAKGELAKLLSHLQVEFQETYD